MTRSEYQRAWRQANRDKVRDYQAAYRSENRERLAEQKADWYRANAERIRAKARARRITDGDTLREQNRRVNRRTERDPVKDKARAIVADAIQRGELQPQPCEGCATVNRKAHDGRRLVQAHHDDYSKPLEVKWLCVDCHALMHRKVA